MRVQNPDQYAAMLLNITHAERALHAGEDPQHVRPQRDRPEIPDADPGQHHLPDRVRGRCRQAADPQGHLRPRRRRCSRCSKNAKGKDLEHVVAHAQPSYARPPSGNLPPGVSFASDNSGSGAPDRTSSSGCSAAAPSRPPAAGRPRRRPSSGGSFTALSAQARLEKILERNQRPRLNGEVVLVNHSPSLNPAQGTFSPHSTG